MTEMKTEQTLLQKEKVQMIQAAVQMGWMLGFEKRKKTTRAQDTREIEL